jgi:AcrR family transcriptional regulator
MPDIEVRTRAYRSTLRAQQAATTRRRIVSAAADRFASSGYQATTLAAIAREAGVSVETVKASASKAELLLAAFEVTFSGEEARDSLTQTPTGEGVFDLPDAAFVAAIVTRIAEANARGHALWTVLLGAALSDEVVSDALREMLDRRAADYRALVTELSRRGIAAASVDLDHAAAVLSFTMSPESYAQLVVQWAWTPQRYRDWLLERVAATVEAVDR